MVHLKVTLFLPHPNFCPPHLDRGAGQSAHAQSGPSSMFIECKDNFAVDWTRRLRGVKSVGKKAVEFFFFFFVGDLGKTGRGWKENADSRLVFAFFLVAGMEGGFVWVRNEPHHPKPNRFTLCIYINIL